MKNMTIFKKTLSLLLVLTMCMSLPLSVFAETITETSDPVNNADGTQTVVTTTTTTETKPDGGTTVTVKIEEVTAGTTTTGVDVNNTSFSTTSTTTDANGNMLGNTYEEGGNEKKEWTEPNTSGENLPPVEVELIPGKETSASATGESTQKVEGDEPTGPDDTQYDYTTTTTTAQREVNAEVSDLDVTITENETDLTPFAPKDFDGKDFDNKEGLLDWMTPDYLVPIFGTTNKDGSINPDNPKPEEDGYDYRYTGYGEATNAVRVESVDVVYKKDPVTGEPMIDEETGEYIIESLKYSGKYNDGFDATPSIFALAKYDEDGNPEYYYGYCIDNDTGAVPSAWYKVSNLEDSDYYPDDESAAKLRAIVNNGYWGQEKGKGSTAQMLEKLRDYYDAEAEVTIKDKNGKPKTYKVHDVIGRMNDADALAVTQAAIWSYANGTLGVQDGRDGSIITGIYSVVKPKSSVANCDRDYDYERDALLQAAYEWLCAIPGEPSTSESVTTIINEKNNVEDMTLVVKDKVADHTNNADNNADNDVYNTELTFTLAFVPDTKTDDLLVYLTDQNGNVISDKNGPIVRRLAGTNTEDRNAETILPDENGVYTLTDLQLQENEDFVFDLRLEGTQYLKEGVYIYTAHGGSSESQTMVGIAGGTQEVDVSVGMTISFNVDETNHVVAERKWHNEGDPTYGGGGGGNGGGGGGGRTFRIGHNPTGGEEDLLEIPDEEVPLADAPKTGDGTLIMAAISALSGIGYAGLNFTGKKKER